MTSTRREQPKKRLKMCRPMPPETLPLLLYEAEFFSRLMTQRSNIESETPRPKGVDDGALRPRAEFGKKAQRSAQVAVGACQHIVMGRVFTQAGENKKTECSSFRTYLLIGPI